MSLCLHIFPAISCVAFYLLWIRMLENGTLWYMISAVQKAEFASGRALRTTYVHVRGVDDAIALLVAFFDPVTSGKDSGAWMLVLDFLSSLQVATIWLCIEGLRKGNKSRWITLYEPYP